MADLRWPAGRPRVLVTDCWLPNAGDAAIALATQGLVQAHAPGAAVLHAAYGAALVADRYPELGFVPPLEALLGTAWAPPDAEVGEAGRRLVQSADLIISQGGGFLRSGYEPWSRIDALERAASLDVPLLVLGQSIGRFQHAFARRGLRRVLRAATAVVLRDPRSRDCVVDIAGRRDGIVLGADVAMVLALGTAAPPPGDAIHVVLSDHVVPGAAEPADRRAVGIALLEAVLAAHPDRQVLLWSTAQGLAAEGDDALARAAVDALDASMAARVDRVTGHVDARRALGLLGESAAVVSMRMHPALLGACLGREVALVSGDHKTAVLGSGPVRAKVYDEADPDAPSACARRLEVGSRPDPRALLGDELLRRLDATVGALADVLARVS